MSDTVLAVCEERAQSLGPIGTGILWVEFRSQSMWVSHLFFLEAKGTKSQEENNGKYILLGQ